MPIQPTYKTGTITVTSGSATVAGTGTAWTLALVNGGSLSFKGFSIPIAAVASDTSLTLDYAAPAGMAGTGAYSINLGRADAASAIVANRQLADLVDLLRNKVSAFGGTLLDDADASTALSTLGISTFIKTLLDDANQSTALTTLGAAGTASPTFTGVPLAPTAANIAVPANPTQLATLEHVNPARSLAASGYQKLPSGLIVQWGSASGTDYTITLPTPFTAAFYTAACTPNISMGSTQFSCVIISGTTLTNFSVQSRLFNAGAVSAFSMNMFWLAIGR